MNVSNEVEIAKLLIEKGIDVHAVNLDGENPLHSLCQSYEGENFVDLAKLLLDNGVGINALDNLGRSALICLSENSHTTTNEMVEMMKFLIESGSDVTEKDTFHKTGLHHLCIPSQHYDLFHNNERVRMAKLLMENGIDINATDEDGRTALHCLLLKRSRDAKAMLKFFIEKGIDIDAKDNEGRDALYYLKHKYEGYDKWEIEKILDKNYTDRKNIPIVKKNKFRSYSI